MGVNTLTRLVLSVENCSESVDRKKHVPEQLHGSRQGKILRRNKVPVVRNLCGQETKLS